MSSHAEGCLPFKLGFPFFFQQLLYDTAIKMSKPLPFNHLHDVTLIFRGNFTYTYLAIPPSPLFRPSFHPCRKQKLWEPLAKMSSSAHFGLIYKTQELREIDRFLYWFNEFYVILNWCPKPIKAGKDSVINNLGYKVGVTECHEQNFEYFYFLSLICLCLYLLYSTSSS